MGGDSSQDRSLQSSQYGYGLRASHLAKLIITDGDPLQIQTLIKHVIIAGSEVSTDNKHKSLYERYSRRI